MRALVPPLVAIGLTLTVFSCASINRHEPKLYKGSSMDEVARWRYKVSQDILDIQTQYEDSIREKSRRNEELKLELERQKEHLKVIDSIKEL